MRQLKTQKTAALSVAALAIAILVTACAPKSPEEKVAALRARYTATLNGFYEKAPEPAEEPMAEVLEAEAATASAAEASATAAAVGAEAEGEEIEGEEAMAEGEMEMETGPRTSDILLDILIRHDSDERLDGITLEITQVDTSQQEKATWRAWFDTSSTVKATPQQVTHILEDVEYEEGDGFSVDVRSYVPAAEQGEYREFDVAAGG